MSIRVVLVDDHPVVRQGLRRMLEVEGDIEVVDEAASGEDALARIDATLPNIVIMDIKMPGISGIEVVRRVKERYPETNFIVLTMYGEQYLAQAIEAGATGYLLKEAGGEELIRAVRAVHCGQSALHPSLSRELFNEFASLAKGKRNRWPSLSPREMDMIRLIADGATNKDIAAQLFLSETTVKRGVSGIFDKLGARDRAEAVAEACRRGLL